MNNGWIFKGGFILLLTLAACSNNQNTADTNNPLFQQPPLKDITERIGKDPANAALYYQRGRMLDKMEQDTLALNDYKKAVSFDSTKAEYFSAIGNLLFEHQDITGSTHWLERALKLNPKDPAAHLKMAKMFIYSKDYTAAFSQINTVLRQDVYNAEGYFLKGMIYKDMKKTDEAISSFRTAVQIDPKYKDAIVQLGLVFSDKKDPIALQYFDNAFRVDSTDLFPIYAKGVYYQDLKEYEKAKTFYHEVIAHDREYINAYFNMGNILIQQDSLEKAYRQYNIITQLQPDNAEAYYNRGLCSELMGKRKEAAADYQQALTFNPKYKEAQDGLNRIKS